MDPFINDVERQIVYMAYVIVDMDIVCRGVICPLRVASDVHRDREMSFETSSSTRTFILMDREVCLLLCFTAYVALKRFLWHHVGHCMFSRCGVKNISMCDGDFLQTPSHSSEHRIQQT